MTTSHSSAVLDLGALIVMFGHDRAKVSRLVLRFVESAGSGFAEMQQCLASGDIVRMRELGHRIKSSARVVGASAMASLCERMEKLPPDPATEQAAAAALLDELLPLLAQASAQIDLYLADDSITAKSPS